MKKILTKENLLKEYSGFCIIGFSLNFAYCKETKIQDFIKAYKLKELEKILEKFKVKESRKIIKSLSISRLKKLESIHKKRIKLKDSNFNSLSNYWKINTRHLKQNTFNLLEDLNGLPFVTTAYLELRASDSSVDYDNDNLSVFQGYLNPAPEGIDAKWAWNMGITGQDVGLIDIEQSWNLNHEDIANQNPSLIYGDNRNANDHGTAVLGEIIGIDNDKGIVGICPTIKYVKVASHYDFESDSSGNVADAIMASIEHMNYGDILLLEIQKLKLPTEIEPADKMAIQLCTSLGIIVIQAAGNGNFDLDRFDSKQWFSTPVLNRNDEGFIDSGAIMVGASISTVPHERLVIDDENGSNYGSRIDCYGWGENVTTTGYGNFASSEDEDVNNNYTNTFSGTSSAAPIIAGAAILIQSFYKNRFNRIISPEEMRQILTNPNTGTPQGQTISGNIGIMPDLRKILIQYHWLEPFLNIVFEDENNNQWLEPFLSINLP